MSPSGALGIVASFEVARPLVSILQPIGRGSIRPPVPVDLDLLGLELRALALRPPAQSPPPISNVVEGRYAGQALATLASI